MGNGFARTVKTTLGHLWELGNRRSRRRGNRGGSLLLVELRTSALRLLLMRVIRKRPKRRDRDSGFDQWEFIYLSKSWTVLVSPLFHIVLFERHDLFRPFHVLALLVIYCLCRPISIRIILVVTTLYKPHPSSYHVYYFIVVAILLVGLRWAWGLQGGFVASGERIRTRHRCLLIFKTIYTTYT